MALIRSMSLAVSNAVTDRHDVLIDGKLLGWKCIEFE
jgi:hypothetical protein